MSNFNLLTDGKMVPGDLKMPVLNPATEEVLQTEAAGSCARD
jgi:hypothetical protein